MKNKYIYLLLCLLRLMIPNMQAQIISVAPNSGFNIKAGTVIGVQGLDLTPASDFSITSNLSRHTTVSNTTTIAHINKSYLFGATTAAFSGAIKFNYLDSDLNRLTESGLKLLYNDGTTWNTDNASVNNAIAKYETATLAAKPLNELSLGISSSTTTILDSQCGTTLVALNSTINCYPVTNATSYKFKIVNLSNNSIRYYVSETNSFNLSQVTGTLYNSTYSISVAAVIGKTIKAYGTACNLMTPHPPHSKIQDSQCGQTLASLGQIAINANAVSGATKYRFKVVANGETRFIESAGRYFYLTSLPGGVLFNTEYTISVAIQYNGIWEDSYGTECVVRTPSGLTKIQDSQFGKPVSSLSTVLYANSIYGATNYRFKVVANGTTRFFESTVRSFRLTSLLGGASYNTTYTISVATKYNGKWGDYGDECFIATPFRTVPSVTRQASAISAKENVMTEVLVISYPNPYTSNFKFDFSSPSDNEVAVVIFDMAGKQIESRKVNPSEMNNLELGSNYPSGVYNVIVTQGTEIKTLRVIKK